MHASLRRGNEVSRAGLVSEHDIRLCRISATKPETIHSNRLTGMVQMSEKPDTGVAFPVCRVATAAFQTHIGP